MEDQLQNIGILKLEFIKDMWYQDFMGIFL